MGETNLVVNMSITDAWHKTSFSNAEVDGKLGEMAAKVAIQHFDYHYATLLFFNSTLYYGVELFLHMFNYNIIVRKGIITPRFMNVTRQFVIFASDVTEVQQTLDTLKEIEVKNIGKFIFICQSQIPNDCNERRITKLLWQYRIVNVVVIKYDIGQVQSFTYFPISNGMCNNTQPVKLDSSDRSQYLTTKHGDIFSMKLKRLSFCPLIVSTFIQTPYMKIVNGRPVGADGDLLRILESSLNTTLVMRTPRRGDGWGFRQNNGTWTGSLADVIDDLANISVTSPALTQIRFSTFHLSRSYYTVSIVWVAHPAMLQDEALKLLHPFGLNMRIVLIVSYLLVILCALITKTDVWSSVCHDVEADQPSRSIFFYSWMICMGQSIIKLPTKSAFLHITILWVYYCFLIRTAYQVYLISSLKGKFYEDPFDSIEDAIRANYPFGGGAALKDYYIDYPEIYYNWINIATPDIIPTAINISEGYKFVLAMNMDTAKVVIKKQRVKLHILRQKIASTPTGMFAKKYSPLMEPINLILSRLVASGIPEKLHKKYTSVKNIERDTDNEQESLKTKHFTACYIILIVGVMVSCLFFSLELYFGRIYKHPLLSR